MRNIQFMDEYKREKAGSKMNPHQDFLEKLKKQVASDDSSGTETDSENVGEDNAHNNLVNKMCKTKLNNPFEDLDGDN